MKKEELLTAKEQRKKEDSQNMAIGYWIGVITIVLSFFLINVIH